MRRAVVIAALVAGCQPTPPPDARTFLAAGDQIKSELGAHTDANGWTVMCTDDHHKAERTCRASTFGVGPSGQGVPLQVYYVNKSGPFIMAGYNTFPGREATVRVDGGAVISEAKPAAVVSALKGGTTAYVAYHVWPTGGSRMTVDVRGFDAAHSRLLSML